MSQSTDAILCFGYKIDLYEEDVPWEEEGFEEWYYNTILNYQRPFEIYNDDGEYINGQKPSDEVFEQYFGHYRQFKSDHPLPCKAVLHCSDSSPMWIMASISSVHEANRGYPITISSLDTNSQDVERLTHFCIENGIIAEGAIPQWYLCSYWET